jgi:phenylacetate-CoA ligase
VNIQGWRINRSRYTRAFYDLLAAYEERATWTEAERCAYRDTRLQAFVRHCQESVPYYRKTFQGLGISWQDIKTLDDLSCLPVLRKETVQARYDEFLSEAIAPHDRVMFHTSGTTGGGLRFATTPQALSEQWAVWWRYRRALGIDIGTLCGYFAGRTIIPLDRDKPPFWILNHPARQLMFSGYHMSPETMDHYVDALNQMQPPWLHGYPSLIALLATHMLENDRTLDYELRWITTGAENLLPHQVSLMERAFHVRPHQHYGLAEAVSSISESPKYEFHIDEDFAATEFLPTDSGHGHRIIGTNFTNPATPLLRYDTQDIADVSGRSVLHIDGREEDYIVLHNGARIGRMDHIFKDMTAIREAQLYQCEPGDILVRIVRGESYTDDDERMLREEFRSRVGEETTLRFEYVSELQRSRSGKLRFVVSDLRPARVTGHNDSEEG